MNPVRLLLTLLFAPLSLLAQPNLTFTPQSVLAAGLSPGGEVVFFAVARIPLGSHQRLEAHREVVAADGAGEAVLELADGVPRRSVWAVVDLASGDYALGTPEDYPLRQASLAPEAFDPGPGGGLDRIRHRHRRLELLLLRPGVGAWTLRAADGGEGDADGAADGTLTTALDALEPLTPAAQVVAALLPGDVVVVLDPERMNVTAARLAGTEP